jgi:glycosyltransferase involved in cell wall biosynthesis
MRISAVIPTYGCSRLLSRAIDSVLAHTTPVDELLVIDDGSTDDTSTVAARYGDRLRYIYQANRGAAAARNRGVLEARNEWIAFLDHDDEWLPSKMAKQVAALQSTPGAIACYCWFWWNVSGEVRELGRLPRPTEFWPNIRLRTPVLPSLLVVKKSALPEIGGFRERLRTSCEDWDLTIRLAAAFPSGFVLVEEPLAMYYSDAGNTSNRHEMMLEQSLSIVEESLLMKLTGIERKLWRRRIRSVLFYQAAVGSRRAGVSGLPHLLRSLLEWPLPTVEPRRFLTLAVELMQAMSLGSNRRVNMPRGGRHV